MTRAISRSACRCRQRCGCGCSKRVRTNISAEPQMEVRVMIANERLPQLVFVQPEFGRVEWDGEVVKQSVVIRAKT